MKQSIDVVVVGAGPVGLLAAIELTLGGAKVLLLDRLPAPSTVTKALSIGALGVEALQRRGMSAALLDAQARTLAAMQQHAERSGWAPRGQPGKFAGHFGGLFLIRSDAQAEPQRRMQLVDQQAIEAMSTARALALGIDVRRGCELTSFAQDAEGVDIAWTTPTGEGRARCAWLVGCDGGRSRVRKLAGFAFPGTDPTLTMYTAIVDIDHPARLSSGGWARTPGGVFSYGAFPRRLFMLDFSGPPTDRQAPVLQQEIEAVLRRLSGEDVRVTAMDAASRWTDNTRLVDHYRQGRVLLAGDAAHVHSPFGGQGMSLGLVDAANLGWKLAAVVRGDRPDSLLDSYEAERRPAAEAVLANTLAQTAIMRPDPQSGAMRDLVADLMRLDDVNRYFGTMMSGLATRYDLGAPDDEGNADIGRLTADRPIDGDMSLYALMQDGAGVLLDASADAAASTLVGARAPRVRRVTVPTGPSMLVRPDACIAWMGDAARSDDRAGLAKALDRWFGAGEARR